MGSVPILRRLSLVLVAAVAGCASTGGDGDARVFHREATWSPDGKTLLLTRHEDGAFAIHSVESDGSDLERLTGPGGSWASWSPDGKRFVFRSDHTGNGEIYVARADGELLDNLTRDPHDDSTPAWSPDGFRIAFTSDRGGGRRLHVMDARGLGQLCVGETEGDESNPMWSPDGRSLVLVETVKGEEWVVVQRADGTARRRLARGSFPSWTADGRRILFDHDGALLAIEPQGGSPTFLCDDARCARASRDGKRLAFLRGPSAEVWVAKPDGSGARRLVESR